MLGDRDVWLLDPGVTFVNHGSFGACPRPVLDEQTRWRTQMERNPVEFLDRRLPGLLDETRGVVAAYVEADPAGLVFVPNATTAVNVVVRAIGLQPADEVVVTNHAYGAVLHTVERACAEAGAFLTVVDIPLPLPSDDRIVESVVGAISDRTRLAIVDHITSTTAAIFPVAALVAACRAAGVVCMVDAAHAPGMVDVDLSALSPDVWFGNFHKWVCAPKGAAVLFVSGQLRRLMRPLVTSHAYLEGFHRTFGWQGTHDPTAYLSIPAAIDFIEELGRDAVSAHNRSLLLKGRDAVLAAMGQTPLVRDDATGWMASTALPDGVAPDRPTAVSAQAAFYQRTRIEVPFVPWRDMGLMRISAHVYNTESDYERLALATSSAFTPDAKLR